MTSQPTITERAEAIVALEQGEYDRWSARAGAVCWSGLQPDAPIVHSLSDVVLRLTREEADREAWRQTPEGRFCAAAGAFFRDTGDDRLLSCFSRGLASNTEAALRVLDASNGPVVDDARRALNDFIALRHARAA